MTEVDDHNERVVAGLGVTGGIAIAPVFVPEKRAASERAVGSPGQEDEALRAAFALAATQLRRLAQTVDDEARGILEFQIELLEDEDFTQPVYQTVASGQAAHAAWTHLLDGEIADYECAGDEVLSARTADLKDLKHRVLSCLHQRPSRDTGPVCPCIIVAADLLPSHFLELDPEHVAGIALGAGSRTSHLALLARARGVPMVVGLGAIPAAGGAGAVLDAENGQLVLHPLEATTANARRRQERAAAARAAATAYLPLAVKTATGEHVDMMVNIDHPSMIETLDPRHCDGIGLVRSEFLFKDGLPDEDAQLAAYAKLIKWANGRPVTFRTLDAGGDKPVPGLPQPEESNPFLGMRGIRLALAHPEVFSVQLRALLRAAALGPLKIMLPMVTVPAELESTRTLMRDAAFALERQGLEHAMAPLGIMIEVPAAALAAESFDADFYSIGSNDLIQYTTAAARDNAAVAALASGGHASVLRLVEMTVAASRARGVAVSVCGDMASDPKDAERLVAVGVRALSVAPATLGTVKAALGAGRSAGR